MSTEIGMPPVLSPQEADAHDRAVLLAAPRGYCAGVDRAVITVEKALDLYGAPVYVRKQIVHNKHVVADLESRGAIFRYRCNSATAVPICPMPAAALAASIEMPGSRCT